MNSGHPSRACQGRSSQTLSRSSFETLLQQSSSPAGSIDRWLGTDPVRRSPYHPQQGCTFSISHQLPQSLKTTTALSTSIHALRATRRDSRKTDGEELKRGSGRIYDILVLRSRAKDDMSRVGRSVPVTPLRSAFTPSSTILGSLLLPLISVNAFQAYSTVNESGYPSRHTNSA